MRQVALTAAVIGGALFLGPAGSSTASHSGAANINTSGASTPASSLLAGTPKGTPKTVQYAAVTIESKDKGTVVKVESGDTLSKIAEAKGTSYQRLYYANTNIDNPDLIFPGQELRVPAESEELTPRPLPESAPVEVRTEAQAEVVTPEAPAPEPEYVAPAPRARVSAPSVAGGSVWDSLAQCEASGNWSINTGNGYYGGLQFNLSSWAIVGGSGLPSDASREEQIMRGQMLQARQGWGAWPACSAKLGLY